MRAIWTTLAIAAATVPVSAGAQEASVIVQARAAGLIGERFDGYLGVVTTPPEIVRKRAAAINIKRRALYSNLAARRGVAAEDVGIAAACSLLARVGVGEAYMLSDGQWRRRALGQAAPRPTYCG